jgi:nucleotide-binding universal stress UspA family protein
MAMTAQPPSGRRPVVVGVDGSASALGAVRWAAVEADRRGAPLRLVTAFSWEPDRGHPGRGEHYREELLERARQHLVADAVTAAERAVPGLDVSSEVMVGFPIGTLYDETARAQLLVLGTRGLGGVTGLLAGSVAVALSAHAACAVVVVRGEDRDPFSPEPVVVGVDGSPNSEAAVGFAFRAAAARKVGLVAVHAWADAMIDPQVAALLDWAALEDDQRTLLSGRLAAQTEEHPEVPVTRLLVRAGATHALVEQSKDAQLVVVGSRGRGNAAGLVLGSVSHGVLHRSHCPVAVVRRDTTGD